MQKEYKNGFQKRLPGIYIFKTILSKICVTDLSLAPMSRNSTKTGCLLETERTQQMSRTPTDPSVIHVPLPFLSVILNVGIFILWSQDGCFGFEHHNHAQERRECAKERCLLSLHTLLVHELLSCLFGRTTEAPSYIKHS